MCADQAKSVVEAESEYWRGIRNKCLEAMDERIKSMALGTLVLIWGVFAGEEHKVIVLTGESRTWFLLVAVGAITVLALDYLEYVIGYMAARQRLPRAKLKPLNYRGWERNAKVAKHVIGCASLLILISVLLRVVVGGSLPEVHAQNASDTEQFVGRWCGSDIYGMHYMVLDIDSDPSEHATYSTFTQNAEKCVIEHPTHSILHLECGVSIGIDAQLDGHLLRADWNDRSEPATGTSLLQNCGRD